ncbi:hypothetical protein RRG08_066882 [Elysia crispata]|uniref:Uncharacterized protein n=1 Tax=Elysia crispata TaxID=231223 RepID=A0AAE1AXX9_9GAST|nr:hypothetical protein RRG08_066882 [Elysia crispata]
MTGSKLRRSVTSGERNNHSERMDPELFSCQRLMSESFYTPKNLSLRRYDEGNSYGEMLEDDRGKMRSRC